MTATTQLTLQGLGSALSEVTFVVVDLETDGGAPADAGITEIGAVKVRGGEIMGTFQSLVRLPRPLPAFIRALTGISDEMLLGAPPLEVVLPTFLDFLGDAVVVAHNAPYDVGFLKAACGRVGTPWPEPAVVDTARLARNALTRDEVPNCKLATLARHFDAEITPNHRAMADARATVDVLHALMERVGNLGVDTLDELQSFSSRVPDARRRKRRLAEGLPDGPGVYVFEDPQGEALYVGTSRSIRRRVLSYFTASEQRPRMNEMIGIAERVVAVPCATALEARIRELRTIESRAPRYNRRSARPHASVWLKLTVERFPRISTVAQVRPDHDQGARYVGPYASRRQAQAAAEAIAEALPLRTCTQALGSRPKPSACLLADLGRCLAPCVAAVDPATYAGTVEVARRALSSDPSPVIEAVSRRMSQLAAAARYEEAADWRGRTAALLRGVDSANTSDILGRIPHLVAARLDDSGAWEVHVIRHGRLAGASRIESGTDPRPHIPLIVAAAQAVDPPTRPASAALPEETLILARWLFSPGVRLVELEGEPLAFPLRAAAGARGSFELDLRDPWRMPE